MKTFDELKAKIEELGVHEQLGPTGRGWGIEQNPDELAKFLVRMQELEVKSSLEIGTGYRAGLARFLHSVMGWKVITYDQHNYHHQFEGITFLIAGDMPTTKVDVVILDASHTYEAVRADYMRFSKLARKVIAVHDIGGLRNCDGAQRYWDEIAHTQRRRLRKNFKEAIAEGPLRAGIGWVELA